MRISVVADNKMDLPRGDKVRILAVADALARSGHKVTLVCAQYDGPIKGLEHYYRELSIEPVRPVPESGGLGAKRALMKRAREIPHDEVQVETAFDAGIARLSRIRGYTVDVHGLLFSEVLFDHGWTYLRNPVVLCREIERYGIRGASRVISVSSKMSEYLTQTWRIQPDTILLARNGFIPERIAGASGTNENLRQPTATFVGNLAKWASVDKILEAAALLQKRQPDLQFLVVGDGRDRQRLEKMAATLGLSNVRFTGFVPTNEAYRIMRASTVLLCPLHDVLALRVACPIKLLEYAALGRALVTDPVGEIPQLLSESSAAFVSETPSSEAFADAIERAVVDEAERDRRATNARTWSRSFDWHTQLAGLVEAYRTTSGRTS